MTDYKKVVRRKKIKHAIKDNAVGFIVCALMLTLVLVAYTATAQDNASKQKEVSGLETQLSRAQKALASYSSQVSVQKDQIAALRGYYEPSHVGLDTVGIVTEKYAEHGQYTLRIDNDYFNVSYETWMNVAVGQEVDYSGWEKLE